MTAAAPPAVHWRTDRRRWITLLGTAVAAVAVLVQLEFLLRPGLVDVLRGLGQHGFVLGLLLLLTARSRTVSLPTLGIFWLLGVWGVYLLAYGLENPMANQFGADMSDEFVPVYWAPFVEETLKLAPVAIFLMLTARDSRRQCAITDGLLLGFMVGAGVSFQEDAHLGEIVLSGDGWGGATPWTAIFPTVSPIADIFALNHALWAGLSGLAVGAAVMFRHWRWLWPVALIGPVLSITNHMMLNHFAGNVFGLLGRAEVPWLFSTINSLTNGGRLPMVALVVGALIAAFVEWLILRWVGKRDDMFPPLSVSHIARLVRKANSGDGLKRLVAAERYLRLRRSVYFSGWRTQVTGGVPELSPDDFDELQWLLTRAGLPSVPTTDMQPSELALPPIQP